MAVEPDIRSVCRCHREGGGRAGSRPSGGSGSRPTPSIRAWTAPRGQRPSDLVALYRVTVVNEAGCLVAEELQAARVQLGAAPDHRRRWRQLIAGLDSIGPRRLSNSQRIARALERRIGTIRARLKRVRGDPLSAIALRWPSRRRCRRTQSRRGSSRRGARARASQRSRRRCRSRRRARGSSRRGRSTGGDCGIQRRVDLARVCRGARAARDRCARRSRRSNGIVVRWWQQDVTLARTGIEHARHLRRGRRPAAGVARSRSARRPRRLHDGLIASLPPASVLITDSLVRTDAARVAPRGRARACLARDVGRHLQRPLAPHRRLRSIVDARGDRVRFRHGS